MQYFSRTSTAEPRFCSRGISRLLCLIDYQPPFRSNTTQVSFAHVWSTIASCRCACVVIIGVPTVLHMYLHQSVAADALDSTRPRASSASHGALAPVTNLPVVRHHTRSELCSGGNVHRYSGIGTKAVHENSRTSGCHQVKSGCNAT